MNLLRILAISALVVIMASCCTPCRKSSSRKEQSLTETQWKLVQLNGVGITAGIGYRLTFNADDNRFSGIGDCNRLNGTYSVDKNGKMSIGMIASTRMACPNLEQESNFSKCLTRSTLTT